MVDNNQLTLIEVQAGAKYWVVADLVTIKIKGEATNGAYALIEAVVPAGGGPPGMHKHPPQETFIILEGEFQFTTLRGGALEMVNAKAGALVHVPPAVPHLYKNVGATAGRLLAISSPAGHENFFAEVGLPITAGNPLPQRAGPPDLERLRSITAKYQIESVRAG